MLVNVTLRINFERLIKLLLRHKTRSRDFKKTLGRVKLDQEFRRIANDSFVLSLNLRNYSLAHRETRVSQKRDEERNDVRVKRFDRFERGSTP